MSNCACQRCGTRMKRIPDRKPGQLFACSKCGHEVRATSAVKKQG